MRRLITGVAISSLLFLSAASLFSQAGYKEYLFGQSVGEIQQKVSDLTENTSGSNFPPLNSAMFYVFAGKYPEIKPVEPLLTGTLVAYDSQSQDLSCWFYDDKLIAVQVHFDDPILKDLTTKYGKRSVKTGNFQGAPYQTIVWDGDSKRVIVWESRANGLWETVTYFDAKWVKQFKIEYQKMMEENSKAKSNRLD